MAGLLQAAPSVWWESYECIDYSNYNTGAAHGGRRPGMSKDICGLISVLMAKKP